MTYLAQDADQIIHSKIECESMKRKHLQVKTVERASSTANTSINDVQGQYKMRFKHAHLRFQLPFFINVRLPVMGLFTFLYWISFI